MASPPYGWREGVRRPVRMKLDKDSADIVVGDFLSVTGFTAGYVGQAAAGEIPVGVAMEKVVVSGTADGDHSVLVDVSEDSIYEYPPDAGTVTQALAHTTMDIGGPQSINIDASADDIVVVRDVDTVANTLRVSLYSGAATRYLGVV